MKTYVLRISKHFMATHPRRGQETHFRDKIEMGLQGVGDYTWMNEPELRHGKIHTLRKNYDYWAAVAEEVNACRAVLSLRQWAGKPYRSKCGPEQEFLQLTKMGVQRASVTIYHVTQAPLPVMGIKGGTYLSIGTIKVDGKEIESYRDFYANDGFTGVEASEDFAKWFGACIYENMALIHFTPHFKY